MTTAEQAELDDLLLCARRLFSAARQTGDEDAIRMAALLLADVCRARIELPLQRRGDYTNGEATRCHSPSTSRSTSGSPQPSGSPDRVPAHDIAEL